MSDVEDALRFDEEDRPVDAIAAYQRAIADPNADLELYLNLAALYFTCADFGYSSHHHIPSDITDTCLAQAETVLSEASSRFGEHPEISFWRRYIPFICLAGEPFYEDALRLAHDGRSLVPYLHLCGRGPYQEQAKQLLEQVNPGRSARQRYIRSVLGSAVYREWFHSEVRTDG
jgi:hypothetical protein